MAALEVFEQPWRLGPGQRPAADAARALAHCEVAIVTAASIANQSIDGLLAATRGCRDVAVIGPSTPLLPAAFAGTPVTLLGGALVEDGPAVLRIVSEGGGTQAFRRHVRKVTLGLSPATNRGSSAGSVRTAGACPPGPAK